MAAPRLARTLTCPNCLGRLPMARHAPSIWSPSLSPSPLQLALTQVRHARTLTRAEMEDLQGIPVRLLRDIKGFGKKNSIIRVKPGRMRNQWHHKGLAEYMTKTRFTELGLTEAAIGVRDRSFGTQLLVDEEQPNKKPVAEASASKKKDIITMTPEESSALLQSQLPAVLTFARKAIAPAAEPEPAVPRSPSLAVNAALSTQPKPASAPAADEATAIFGSVSTVDILAHIREVLQEADQTERRVGLEADAIAIEGLDLGEDRIKRLGRFELVITTGRGVEPVRRIVEVVAEEE
ncbi:hypothetical protein JX265_004631 [Neoarthrinium moseri]|uniref:Ribosomal protein L9 domain-containing protein n=1 Tax=Neoarthrinium moseri TaxID=1658444 RepID=A0A9P9WQ01_9PEZI|nr:hypothetical protein JX265_004631 [Neoarthrinium moseri]